MEVERMTDQEIKILPYPKIVGQEQLKLALELTYIAPRLGGVLISGRGERVSLQLLEPSGV